MKKIIIGLIVLLILLVGCVPITETTPTGESGRLNVLTKCEDKVVCYFYLQGMDCFRNEDLVAKYCKG